MAPSFPPRPDPAEPLQRALSAAAANWARFRSGPLLEAFLREAIPIYALPPGRARLEPTGDWYCRVAVRTESDPASRLVGVQVRLANDEWLVDEITEADALEPAILWLDEQLASVDSDVGLFRDERLGLASLYVVALDQHRIAWPTREIEPDLPKQTLVDTPVLMAFIRRQLEMSVLELPADPPASEREA